MWGISYWGKWFFGSRYWGKTGAPAAVVVPGSDPQCTFRFSGDGGRTYGNDYRRSMGRLGQFKTRMFVNGVGTFHDFVVEMFGSDPVRIALTGANMDVELLKSPARGVAAKDGPQMALRVSYDGGKSYTSSYSRSMGRTGEYSAVCSWNNPGMGRDCVVEVSGSDPVRIILTGANMDVEGLAS